MVTDQKGKIVKALHDELSPLEDLSYDEQRDRLNLERKIERSFYEAGMALREIRDRRLYRSTHGTFKAYCYERFGFSSQNINYQISAALVVENLREAGIENLPNSVRQALPLASLAKESQPDAWTTVLGQKKPGKRPTGKDVRDVVKLILENHEKRGVYFNPYRVGSVVQIHKKGDSSLAKYSGCWGIVSIREVRQCSVVTWDGETIKVKPENLEELEVQVLEFKKVAARIQLLMERHACGAIALSRGQIAFLSALGSQKEDFEMDDIETLAAVESIAMRRYQTEVG